jgi:hypothetical protein
MKNAESLIKSGAFVASSLDPYWIALAYDNFALIKEQACATYVRHLKKDAYGKEDTRKIEKIIINILKNEGLWEKQWSSADWVGLPVHVPIIVEFSKLNLEKNPIVLTSPHDSGIRYEEECKLALEEIGATVQKTSAGADYGADLIFEYDGFNFVAQCKALHKKAGIKCIQEIVTAKLHYKADAATAFSLSGFSDAAEKIATSNKVLLFEGIDLESINKQISLFL